MTLTETPQTLPSGTGASPFARYFSGHVMARYLFTETLRPSLIALGILISLVWLLQSVKFLDFVINKGLGMGTFLHLTLLMIPKLLIVILPLAFFAGMVAAGRRWLEDSELTVQMATGRSRLNVAAPALMVGVAAVIAGYTNSLWLMPHSNEAFKSLQYELRTMNGNLLLEEGSFNQLGGLMIYLKKRTGTSGMEGLLVYDTRDPKRQTTWIAREGRIETGPDGSPRIILTQGIQQQISNNGDKPGTERVETLSFEEHTLDLGRSMGSNVIEPRVPDKEEFLLPGLLAAAQHDARHRNELLTEANRRLLWPLTPLPLMAVAAGFMLQRPQRHQGTLRRMIPAVVVAVGYYGILLMGNAWGESSGLPLLAALWLLPAGTLLGAFILLKDKAHA